MLTSQQPLYATWNIPLGTEGEKEEKEAQSMV